MRTRTVLLALAGAMTVAVAIAGCSSGGSSSKATNGTGAGGLAASMPSEIGAPNAGASAPADSSAGSTGGGSSAFRSSAASTGTLISDARSVIRRAELTVGVTKTSDVAIQANAAEGIVSGLGGDVFGDDRQSGTDATATLTLKVPPASLINALNQLSKLGTEQSRALSSQDVTTQVADVDARVKSAESSIARLRTLFASATKVGDVISIEDELSNREADLESLQAQQKTLATETQMATISLVLTTAKATVVKKPTHHSTNAFVKGWHHFTAGGGWLITVLVSVVPFALIAVLIWIGVLRTRRRRVVPEPAAA